MGQKIREKWVRMAREMCEGCCATGCVVTGVSVYV